VLPHPVEQSAPHTTLQAPAQSVVQVLLHPFLQLLDPHPISQSAPHITLQAPAQVVVQELPHLP
jgi:hypothetical protein